MSLNLNNINNSIKNLLDKNNTTTSAYNISAGLNSKVKNVIVGLSEAVGLAETLYPVVYVELKRKTEEFAQLGNNAMRDIDLYYDIVPIVSYGMGNCREESDNELYRLSQNVETLFRNYINLSNTVDYAILARTEYNVSYSNDTWNSIAKISLECRKLST